MFFFSQKMSNLSLQWGRQITYLAILRVQIFINLMQVLIITSGSNMKHMSFRSRRFFLTFLISKTKSTQHTCINIHTVIFVLIKLSTNYNNVFRIYNLFQLLQRNSENPITLSSVLLLLYFLCFTAEGHATSSVYCTFSNLYGIFYAYLTLQYSLHGLSVKHVRTYFY